MVATWKQLSTSVAIAAALSLLGNGAALASDKNGLVRVSDPSPFAGCTIGAADATSVNYPSAEVEPFLAISPRNSRHIMGIYQQDRWNDGGAHGLVAGISGDGGKSFEQVPLPFSSCARHGLPYERASDPWISTGPDGRVYVVSISFDATTFRSAVGVATSTDGGETWNHVQTPIADNDPVTGAFNDKESVTADPTRAGTAYVVWDRGVGIKSFISQAAYFSKTVDGGRTWSVPRAITVISPSEGTIGSIIVVDPRTGALYDVFDRFFIDLRGQFITSAEESLVISHDGGITWSGPIKIGDDLDVGVVDPVTGAPLRTSAGLPEVAIDPETGALYVVWEDARFSNGQFDEVALSVSRDGGQHWSAPERVNRPTGRPAFTPMVALDESGNVGVFYYDLRFLAPDNSTTLPTAAWMTVRPASGTRFNRETQLTPSPFDHLKAPFAVGLFLGDYVGFAATEEGFRAFFTVVTKTGSPDNRTDIVTTAVSADSGEEVSTESGTASTAGALRAAARPLRLACTRAHRPICATRA